MKNIFIPRLESEVFKNIVRVYEENNFIPIDFVILLVKESTSAVAILNFAQYLKKENKLPFLKDSIYWYFSSYRKIMIGQKELSVF